jgi:hypothetical protein
MLARNWLLVSVARSAFSLAALSLLVSRAEASVSSSRRQTTKGPRWAGGASSCRGSQPGAEFERTHLARVNDRKAVSRLAERVGPAP